jgi:RNA polymerase sigma-70 factor (ECF subfamily)
VQWRRSSNTPPSDDELVRHTLAGHRDAFDELIERYQRRATSVACRLLGNLHDALEVCQEAFVRAFQSLDTLEDQGRFGSWLLRIVTNLSLNFRRARGSGARKLSFEDCLRNGEWPRAEQVAAPAYSDEQPGARTAAADLAQIVQAAITELPDLQRTALVLFSIEQLPQKEVAQIMGCSVEAVKWHVFQARKRLKTSLSEYL